MNFSNKNVTRAFATPHSQNVWGSLSGMGWRKVKKRSNDGSTNMFLIICAARANNRKVTGKTDSKKEITELYF